MIAGINKLRCLSLLLMAAAVACAPDLYARQETTESSAEKETPESRRIERLGEVTTDEWEMDLALPPAVDKTSSVSSDTTLPDEAQNRRLQQLLSSLAANPRDAGVNARLNELLTEVLGQANELMDAGSFAEAERLILIVQSINPSLPNFNAAKARLQSQ
ncbi:MAG: hypothetical protein HKP21_10545, partial [Xanthomonadales bacterium]|nr:hypothetical protein [Gammaproteobacteria bacterium]NNK04985.1 hypothetical protein [Xanthomonadales bacterium]